VEALHNDLLDECTLLKQTYEKTGGDTSLGAQGRLRAGLARHCAWLAQQLS
jgi:hypothetical protein